MAAAIWEIGKSAFIKHLKKFKKNVLKLMLNGMDRGGKDDKTKKDE